jgi:hypothetical protein
MGLCPHFDAASLICHTLDHYMMQMHAADIAKALQSLTDFGERVASLIRKNPAAPSWWIRRDLLIHRRHWYALCRNVMNLIRLTGLEVDDLAAPLLHRWPDRGALQAAARAAANIFGPFTGPGTALPSLRLLLAGGAASAGGAVERPTSPGAFAGQTGRARDHVRV